MTVTANTLSRIASKKLATIGRNWCFVINNPNESDFLALEQIMFKGLVWQEEVGDEGTLHIQGYIELHKSTTRACITRRLGGRANCSLRRRSQRVAAEYCGKETFEGALSFCEIKLTNQGQRSDISTIKEKIKNGISMVQIAEEHFGDFIRYNRGFYLFKRIISEPRTIETRIHVIWGRSGIGKSHAVSCNYPEAYWVARPNCGTVWFDDLSPTQDLVFDNYYGWCPYDLLLRIIDRYPMLLPTRHHGFINWKGRRVITTSVKPWEEWYDFSKCDKSELERRIKRGRVEFLTEYNTHEGPTILTEDDDSPVFLTIK